MGPVLSSILKGIGSFFYLLYLIPANIINLAIWIVCIIPVTICTGLTFCCIWCVERDRRKNGEGSNTYVTTTTTVTRNGETVTKTRETFYEPQLALPPVYKKPETQDENKIQELPDEPVVSSGNDNGLAEKVAADSGASVEQPAAAKQNELSSSTSEAQPIQELPSLPRDQKVSDGSGSGDAGQKKIFSRCEV
ncbi:unnamed protein product [Ambrosiozyma monospora]|uniref:Unnamed protein product n=1 Tax=Ambrosiozyma monospora TaxID=43982 RepID=A0ACB5TD05_AMBMO|nr:unnamed protein product [Ambrosiozyma monospora]